LTTRALIVAAVVGLACAASTIFRAEAQDRIKIGVPTDFTGASAIVGQRTREGVELFLSEHGTHVGGRDVEVEYRDIRNGSATAARQVVEEMIIRDKISMIVGFVTTPEVTATAALLTQFKTPAILVTASTPSLLSLSPYLVRAGNNTRATVRPAAEWAYKTGKRRGYTAVMDFKPGYEVEDEFKKTFSGLGGEIVGSDRIPLSTVDFSPYVERIARSNADIVQLFILNGSPSVAFVRALAAGGALGKDKTFIGLAETDDGDLSNFDDSVIGFYSSLYYAQSIDNDENRKFKDAYAKKFGSLDGLGYVQAAAYDSMRVAYHMIEAQQGKEFDGTAAIKVAKGYSWNGPRGPITIDPASRDVIENMYIRRVERDADKLKNVIVDTYPQVEPIFQ
jgi:branched-chain amino acid transport system substrate-binding protein